MTLRDAALMIAVSIPFGALYGWAMVAAGLAR